MLTKQTTSLIASMINGDQTAIIEYSSDLMPAGKPNFENIRYYPSIIQLVAAHGKKDIRKVLAAIVKNFNDSINVPEGKKLNTTQTVEVACFLLDECNNYRIEDYIMMFSLAKRGKIGNIFDRVDMPVISDIKANYEALRREYSERMQEEELRKKEYGDHDSKREVVDEPEEVKEQRFKDAMNLFAEMKKKWEDEKQERMAAEEEARREKLLARIQEIKEKFPEYDGPLIVPPHLNPKQNSEPEQNSSP